LADPETKYDGMTESTYRVVFLEDKYGRHFAAKIFPSGPYEAKAEADFRHEATRNKMALENDNPNQEYLVLALESGRGEKPFKLPSGDTVYEYNYLLTTRHSKGSLLALLMRSNHNNGNGSWYKLSIKLQRYLARQVCSAIFYLHTQDQLAHGDIKPDNIVMTKDYKLALIDLGHTERHHASVQKWTGTP
jgi:serine/threonine protein kinase